MSDFNVHTDVQDLSWYASTAHPSTSSYSNAYAPPAAQHGFEDEAPLLEGKEPNDSLLLTALALASGNNFPV